MASPAGRFTRLQKIAIFLLVIGEERARESLVGMDIETLGKIDREILELGELTPQEKASVMIEFGDLFYKDKPLKGKLEEPPAPAKPAAPAQKQTASPPPPPVPKPDPAAEEAIRNALAHLRQRVDPGKIDWGKAGYDFGEGFKGPQGGRR